MKLFPSSLLILAIICFPVSGQGVGAESSEHTPTGIEFPPKLGDMTKGKATDYETKTPGLGIGIFYSASSGIIADIYIYSGGLKQIPDGAASDEIASEMKRAASDIHMMEKMGKYHGVQSLDEGLIPLGKSSENPKALMSSFTYTIVDKFNCLSYIYLTAYRNHFIKIRFTCPRAMANQAETIRSDFLDAVSKLLVPKPVHANTLYEARLKGMMKT